MPSTEHCEEYEKAEVRIASPAAHQCGFAALAGSDSHILEIRPFTKSVLCGPRGRYFDAADPDDRLKRTVQHAHPTKGCLDVDRVSPTGDLPMVNIVSDSAFIRHCVDRELDLIDLFNKSNPFLQSIEWYYQLILGEFYRFDAPLTPSPLAEIPAKTPKGGAYALGAVKGTPDHDHAQRYRATLVKRQNKPAGASTQRTNTKYAIKVRRCRRQLLQYQCMTIKPSQVSPHFRNYARVYADIAYS